MINIILVAKGTVELKRLNAVGFHPRLIEDVRECLSVFKSMLPDILILHANNNTIQQIHKLITVLKSNKATFHIPIMIMHESLDTQTMINSYYSGADEIIALDTDNRIIASKIDVLYKTKKLHDKISKSNEEYQKKQKQASVQEKMELMNEMIMSLNQQLKNPLTSILTNVQLLQRDSAIHDPQQKIVQDICEKALMLKSIMDSLNNLESHFLNPEPV